MTDCGSRESYYGNFGPSDVSGATATGVYPTEQDTDKFRWSKGDAIFALAPLSGDPPRTLFVRVAALNPVPITISIGGKQLVQSNLSIGRHSFFPSVESVDFTKGQNVEIKTGTWTPPKVNGFTRTLGVEILNVELRRETSISQ